MACDFETLSPHSVKVLGSIFGFCAAADCLALLSPVRLQDNFFSLNVKPV